MGSRAVMLIMSSLCAACQITITQPKRNYGYSVIMDAGSTSTKLRIYQWPIRYSSLSFLNISEIYYQKFSPGIDTFIDDENSLLDYVKPMISNATCRVPFLRQRDTPIYLMATAGLRLLSEEKSTELMNSLRTYLADPSTNPFLYLERSVRILSGEEEGVFSWISANYHLGLFGSKRPASEAVGVLEMGGGSTQITFHPNGPILANLFSLRVAGHIYDLYSHSYLYFGQTYMRKRIIYSLINDTISEINNPCWLRDDVDVVQVSNRNVVVRGTGEPEKCLTIIYSFLQSAHPHTCYPKPCAIGNVYQPSVGSDLFYAIAAFTYAPISLQAVDSAKTLDLQKLNKTAFEYCKKTVVDADVQYSVELKYASDYCMMALYIPALLTTAYDFPPSTKNIYIKNSINGQKVDWSLGAVIYETEIREEDYPCTVLSAAADISHNLWILMLTFSMILQACRDISIQVISLS